MKMNGTPGHANKNGNVIVFALGVTTQVTTQANKVAASIPRLKYIERVPPSRVGSEASILQANLYDVLFALLSLWLCQRMLC